MKWILLTLTFAGATFWYFSKKFSPSENHLSVNGEAINVPMVWSDTSHSALLVPVQVDTSLYYMQLDLGSPETLLYAKSGLNEIRTFSVGNLEVEATAIRQISYGQALDPNKEINIIGTIGTDLLELRTLILNYKNNLISFTSESLGQKATSFHFKKRRVLFPSKGETGEFKLLFDTGTSAYQLITDQDTWNRLRIQGAQIREDKGNSWGKTLQVYSAPAASTIEIGQISLPLTQVTYVEGTSKTQNLLMRFSGMKGMIGNQLFLGHVLKIDARNQRFQLD